MMFTKIVGETAFANVRSRAQELGRLRPEELSEPYADGLDRAGAALALFENDAVSTNELVQFVGRKLAEERPTKEAFVPIFLTNHCHSGCKMCGMRRNNSKLKRQFSSKSVIEDQLQVLREA